MVGLENKIILY